jgi:hypothetical protein
VPKPPLVVKKGSEKMCGRASAGFHCHCPRSQREKTRRRSAEPSLRCGADRRRRGAQPSQDCCPILVLEVRKKGNLAEQGHHRLSVRHLCDCSKIDPDIDSSPRILPRLLRFAVHTVSGPGGEVRRKGFGEFLVCRITEGAAHCTVAASVPDKFRILQKFLQIFSPTPRLIY